MESGTAEPVPTHTLNKIGDCDAPAPIAAAVYAGHRYARELESDMEQSELIRQDRLF
jgi:dimethylamine/trimethylamine dehydrogenase